MVVLTKMIIFFFHVFVILLVVFVCSIAADNMDGDVCFNQDDYFYLSCFCNIAGSVCLFDYRW